MHNQPREPQPYEDGQAKSIQEFGWTSQGMDWGWGQIPDVSRNMATVVVFLLLSHSWGLIYKACVRSDLILECAYA